MSSYPYNYPYIVAWGRLMGSAQYYVMDQLRLAKMEHAPATAIYRTAAGTWRCLEEDVARASTRDWLKEWVATNMPLDGRTKERRSAMVREKGKKHD